MLSCWIWLKLQIRLIPACVGQNDYKIALYLIWLQEVNTYVKFNLVSGFIENPGLGHEIVNGNLRLACVT